MSEYFRGKSWTALTAKELRRYGDADALFTVKAYCYFLPAYLMAALREPKELDVCADHLWFRFGPKLDEEWCLQRLADVCDELNEAELSALLQFFRFQLGEGEDFDGYLERSIKNLEHTLSQRHSRSDE